MFDKLLKKPPPPQPPLEPAQGVPEAELHAWREKLAGAQGDDETLLQLAREAPGVELKLAALSALTQEDALKRAMREYRDADKRLHRAAKSRWQAAVARRESLAEAHVLIAGARTLLEQERVPANRLVELDRAWDALSGHLADEAVAGEFADVRARLGAKVREYGEGEQAIVRWLAAADAAMKTLTDGLPDVARGVEPKPTEEQAAALLQLLSQVPGASGAAIDARCTEKIESANRALALASSVVQRAEFLQSLPAPGVADEAEEKAKIEQWRAFPEVAASELQDLLALRFSQWRIAAGEERQRTRPEEKKLQLAALRRQVEKAEAAQAAGQVAELARLIAVIDQILKQGAPDAVLARRIDTLRREEIRLRDWQRWSGSQRREELVAEAKALAAAAGGEKLALKAHAEGIEKLRERWKELDKLGAPTSKALWTDFDGALKAAYVPVAAHVEKLKSARQDNLATRNKLIDGLVEARGKFVGGTPDWRAAGRAVHEAKIGWRKLGPVEHTVPREAQKGEQAVAKRYAAALDALEGPLNQAYREAGEERQRLISAAKSLAEAGPNARDTIDKVRALQTQWQAHAKGLPLPRGEENALWNAFKAATDAVFAARDAQRASREAEAAAQTKARDAVIETLNAAIAANGRSATEVKRALATAETAWRAAPPAPKQHAAKLDARYRAAVDNARKRLRAIAEHAAQARYDALIAAMQLCREREASGEPTAESDERWNALTDLPGAWKSAMEARFRGVATSKPQALPETLLNLEIACDIETPSEFAAARRLLKMQALKLAMEDRRTRTTTPEQIERWLIEAAATPRPDELSQVRLEKIIAATRAAAR